MKKANFTLFLIFVQGAIIAGLALPASLRAASPCQPQNFITVDVPGAENTGLGGINAKGVITGTYRTADKVYHGFVRSPDGAITTFDAEGSSPIEGHGTFVTGINQAGAVAGYYSDTNLVWHGFVRDPDGIMANFDVPEAGTSPDQGTHALGIDKAGEITGYYWDANFRSHGFLRESNGTITAFDNPESSDQGIFPSAINVKGAITGYYFTTTVGLGFVRAPDGTFASFAAPGPIGGTGTVPEAINSKGDVTGFYEDQFLRLHGFVRARNGSLTTFDAAPAGPGQYEGTRPEGINSVGTIVGSYINASGLSHSFIRCPSGGAITIFDPPGNVTTSGARDINRAGEIIGNYSNDPQGVPIHGYIAVSEMRTATPSRATEKPKKIDWNKTKN